MVKKSNSKTSHKKKPAAKKSVKPVKKATSKRSSSPAKKATPKKSAKKTTTSKSSKKATKPVAKKKAVSKKTSSKPVAKKATKKAGTTKAKPTKKVSKPVKKAAKAAPKKKQVAKIVKAPVKKAAPVLLEGQFEMEYIINCPPRILYEFLITPSGLSEWFADDVNIRDQVYTFYWDNAEQKAKQLEAKDTQYVRYQWLDDEDDNFFEFRIQTDELTGDVALIIVDFADSEAEEKTSRLLWDSQVNSLMHVLGSS